MKILKLLCCIGLTLYLNNGYTQVPTQTGKLFLDFIKEQKWSQIEDLFATSVKSQITAEGVKKIFGDIATNVGELESYSEIKNVTDDKKNQFFLSHFSKATLVLQVRSDDSSKIVGFFFLPPDKLYRLPSYSDDSKYKLTSISVDTSNIKLPGILTLPNIAQTSKVPIVIMIGGSGPDDMDETIGTEKPFKDISIGLAINGVASLRFDKRTFVYHNLPENITIEQEYFLDIKSAIKLAKITPGIDTNKIFILGHSLGGMIAPIILKNNPSLCGAILIEANARPLEDLMYEQSVHLGKINNQQNQAKQTEILKSIQEIKNIAISDTSKKYLNVKGSYWMSLNKLNPVKTAKTLKHQSLLIIQGGYDYQVTKTDFDIWSSALSENKNVSFKFYPTINHSLTEGKGSYSPEEYYQPLNAPMYISADISNWINLIK